MRVVVVAHAQDSRLVVVERQVELLLAVRPRRKREVTHVNVEREVVCLDVTRAFVDGLRDPENLTREPDVEWVVVRHLLLDPVNMERVLS